jgi:hypothetical protein
VLSLRRIGDDRAAVYEGERRVDSEVRFNGVPLSVKQTRADKSDSS